MSPALNRKLTTVSMKISTSGVMTDPLSASDNASHGQHQTVPADFVLLEETIPDLVIDLKYAGQDNFVGYPLPGYQQARAMLTRDAALALRSVQDQLRPLGLGLKIFDAYRPQRTVDFFLEWAKDSRDNSRKAEFYPALDKPQLLAEGYLNSPSGHSRGSTVDLTLIRRSDDSELDMGTPFDFFGPASWTNFSNLSETQRSNRAFLQKIMNGWNFSGVKEEWWHFTLKNEPYPDRYFDFLTGS
tara:strand:+ start:95273 stop:96001 length:729 start_codon:yes stop_codon:yes gene_type:complete